MKHASILLAVVGGLTPACIRTVAEVPPPAEGTTISGQATTKDPLSQDFVPLVGATANARGTSVHATSDDRGLFRIDRLPIGAYDVLVQNRRGSESVGALITGVRLEVDGQAFDLGEVRLGALGTVEGRVRRLDADASVAGVLVVLAGTALRGFTDREGIYRIGGVPQGEYTVTALLPGAEPVARPGVTVGASERTLVADLVLRDDATTDQTVVTGTARALDIKDGGVTVRFTNGDGATFEAVTDATDAFELRVNVGAYRVRFERDDYLPVEISGVVVLREGVIGLAPVFLVPATVGDVDGDGVPDDVDPDRDNDGIANPEDTNPDDPTRGPDLDKDGAPDEIDPDTDGDTLDNDEELSEGLDGFITDPLKKDTDDDGIDDAEDNCPTLRNPDQADVCTANALCDLSPPRLLSVAPSPVRIGQTVLVTAQPLAAPACAPTGPGFAELVWATRSGGTVTSTIVQTSLRGVVIDGVAAQQAEYPVPVGATTGTVTVVLPYAAPSRGAWLEVESAVLAVTEVLPFATDRGETLTVLGDGFAAARGGPLRVGFPGSRPIEVRAERDDRFEVEVPLDADEGPGQVSLRNELAETAFGFTVSSTVPRLARLEPEMVQPGVEELAIFGANLDVIEAVRFTGGARAEPTLRTAAELRVDVPGGVRAGPVALEYTDGPDIVSSVALSTVTNRRVASIGGSSAALVYTFDVVNGLRLLGFGNNAVQVYTYPDVTPVGPSEPFPGAVYGVAVRRARDRAIVTVSRLNDLQTYVVRLSDRQIVAECDPPLAPPGGRADPDDYAFSDNGRYGYLAYTPPDGVPSVLRVDVESTSPAETCTLIPLGSPCTGAPELTTAGVTAFREPDLLGFFTNLGPARLGQTFGSAPALGCVTPPAGTLLQSITPQRMLWDEANRRIWVASTGNLFVFDDDPAGGQLLTQIPSGPHQRLIHSPGGRWLIGGDLSVEIMDRVRMRRVWRGRFRTTPQSIDVHPNGREIMVYLAEIEFLEIESVAP